VYSGAIARLDGPSEPGVSVDVVASDGRFLARGLLSPKSQIVVRICTWQDEEIGPAMWRSRLEAALSLRQSMGIAEQTTAWRLVNAESDLMPGLVVDRYGDYLVCQMLTAGMERWKPVISELLRDLLAPVGILERSDADVRLKEGLERVTGMLAGDPPPPLVEISEHSLRFNVDLFHGHKTGAYLDQRENRVIVGRLARDRDVLNAFAYSGGFGVHAAAGGARSVVHLDSSADALNLARANCQLNPASRDVPHEFVEGNAFAELRAFRAAGRSFDLIVLDPPKFAESVSQLPRALNGYKDINLVALQILRPGGILATFSCSGLVSATAFQQVVWEAGLDAQRDVRIVQRLTQGPDHPVLLNFPEGDYLKGLVLRA
jgi:23S rRNA (cytosine1962-C5)-methyltransferase